MDSYKDFAQVYDELIQKDIDYTAWSDFITTLMEEFNIPKGDYVDLACGTGNLTLPTGKKFKNVWGVDLSSEMLSNAFGKLAKAGISPKLVCQDICELNLNHTFDLMTCSLDSINYITNLESLNCFFQGAYKHLNKDGLFIFDINSYYKITKVLGDNIFTYNSEDLVYIWENTLSEEMVCMYLTFFVKAGESYNRFEEEHQERAYKVEEIKSIVNNNNFKLEYIFDGYNRISPSDKTERLLFVLRKRGE